MGVIYEWEAAFSSDKQVVRQYGKSGTEYKYPGSKNHMKVTFTAFGLEFSEALAVAAQVQAASTEEVSAITDSLGNTYTGSLETVNGSRPVKGSKRFQVSCQMWDPAIS